MKPKYQDDLALVFFASTCGLLLAVSMPATYAVVAPFHNTGATDDWLGVLLALATLLAFEIGAVGCKLVTLAIPRWSLRMNVLTIALLVLTTIANYANGYDLFVRASLAPTLASIRSAGYAPLVAVIYSATIPLLLFVFLSATVARARQLGASPLAATETSLADQRDRAILGALETLTARLGASDTSPLAITETRTPVEPSPLAFVPLALPSHTEAQNGASVETLETAQGITEANPSPSLEPASQLADDGASPSPYSCPHCNASLANPGLIGLARRYGYCAACKPASHRG